MFVSIVVYLSGDSNLFGLSSLGILGQQNGFTLIQSLFAMIILARKCIFLMRDLNPTQIAFNGFSNRLVRILLTSPTGVCNNGSVVINGTEYIMFSYLSHGINNASNSNNNSLLKFIEKFDPCTFTCSTSTIGCTAFAWQNGVCLDGCNCRECNYDGGDCNQLCDGEFDLCIWFNDECDVECNTTECNWDIAGVNESANCSQLFNILDLNDNGFIGWYEAIQYRIA